MFDQTSLFVARLFLVAVLLLATGCRSTEPVAEAPAEAPAEVQADTLPEPTTPQPPVAAVPSTPSLAEAEQIEAGRFDNGKMWTFDYPPLEYLEETYGFRPDEAWLERARLGALRLPNCSASFVSAQGLVMTNHHCAREAAREVARPGEDLVENGFYASSIDEERLVEGLYVDQLVEITDVTDEVYAALEPAETDAERAEALRAVTEEIEQRLAREGEDLFVEVISLYNGGRYSAYTFRRYDDVRLVMVPELQLGYYGGDPDNFTYPRYALDMAFLRVYEDGRPLDSPHFFTWSEEGVEAGDLVFAIGNPGATFRLETVAQVEFRRDVREPAVLRFLRNRAEALEAFLDANPDHADAQEIRNRIFGLRNGVKLYEGRVEALRDETIMVRRADAERKLQEAIEADPALQSQYGDLIARMEELQEQKLALAEEFAAYFLLENPAYASATLRRAMYAYRYLAEQQRGAAEGALEPLLERLLAVEAQPEGVDERMLAERLTDFQHYFGADSPIVQEILGERSPEEVARAVMDASVLADSAQTAQAVRGGMLTMEDPAVQLAAAFVPDLMDFQSAWAGLTAQEQELARRLGQARFDIYGTAVPPDATFSLRLADGVVEGYAYNGTVAPPYTTFYGLYDHYFSYGPDTPWELPEGWLSPPEGVDLSTPLNFVSTADITGGNSGLPVVNEELEIVGLIFDGNIESLSGDYIYLPDRNRAVAVDARGILEAMDEVYEADRLVLELTGEAFVPTEQEADTMTSRL